MFRFFPFFFETNPPMFPSNMDRLHLECSAWRSLISQWAQAHGVDLKRPAAGRRRGSPPSGHETLQKLKQTLETLVKNLGNRSAANQSVRRDAVREIKSVSKENHETLLRIVEVKAVSKILPLLSCGDSQTEKNSMAALFYLSLDDKDCEIRFLILVFGLKFKHTFSSRVRALIGCKLCLLRVVVIG